MILPYALVLSGAVQEETGRRVLWFLKYPPLVRLVAINALAADAWLVLGAVWIFPDSTTCSSADLPLVAASVCVWSALGLASLPPLLMVLAPCLALCKCRVGFVLIALMAGIHRKPRGCEGRLSEL